MSKGVCGESFIEVISNHFGTFLCRHDSMFFSYIYQPTITVEKNSVYMAQALIWLEGRKVFFVCLLSRKLRASLFLHVQCRCLSNVFETKHSDLLSFMLCPVEVFSIWNPQSVLLLVVLVDAAFISYHISFFFSLCNTPLFASNPPWIAT